MSQLGAARLIGPQDEQRYERLTAGNMRHAEDALLALTARDERAILVTHDRRLTAQAKTLGVDVMDTDELVQQLTGQPLV